MFILVLKVSKSVDLDNNQYGTTLSFYCSVDMTPVDISYKGILNVDWYVSRLSIMINN